MKKVKILLAALLAFGFLYSCNDSENVSPRAKNDQALIDAIASANKVVISAAELPSGANSTLNSDYSDDFLDNAMKAAELGYQVDVRRKHGADAGKMTNVYFDKSGRELMGRGRKGGKKGGHGEKICLELIYPVSFTMPDASVITLESKENWSYLKDWYKANPGIKEAPALVFPVQIDLGDGQVQTIANQEELKAANQVCRQDGNEKPERCFQIVFPFTVTMPDGSSITLESKDDKAKVKAWYEAHPDQKEKPALVFPVDIEYRDGSVVTIQSAEEMEQAKANCHDDDDDDEADGDDD